MIRVLIADDHDLVRAGLARMLEDEPGIEVVGQADSGEQAISFVRENAVDIILMDIRMPGMGGLEAIKRLQRLDDSVRVIVVTAVEEDPYPSRVLKSGASAYITKGADLREMIKAIRLVHSGQRYISPDIAQKMALKPFHGSAADNPFSTLSEREMQIAVMVVSCKKVQDISDQLCLSPKTINTYRYRLFEKLGISSDVELTLLAVRHGIVDESKVEGF
ncbi:UvrY/SirA/GacA family response regulator transcription factor [Allohahella sp. A8]|uniref:UvrY/SirA/GacA family response regulator transcription factor n=1 Tax=Allohahella sp. A8 TaxID=3141461 RepID=UPI000C0A2109|nr:two-component system response regulator UvrY [Hahellaceae bacterium]